MSKDTQNLSEIPGEYYSIIPLDGFCLNRNLSYSFRFIQTSSEDEVTFFFVPGMHIIEVNPNNPVLKRFDDPCEMGRYVARLLLAVTDNGRRRFGGKRVADAMNRLVEAQPIADNCIHLELASKTAIEAVIKADNTVTEAQRQEVISILDKFYKAPQEPAREVPSLEQSQQRGKLLGTKEILDKCHICRSTLNNHVKKGALKRACRKGFTKANGYWQVDVEAIWGPHKWS